MRAYSSSKIALGLFGLELQRRSEAAGWGITSNLAHPGVAPTSLLAARPEVGRARRHPRGRGSSERCPRRGVLVGTVETAALPALLAATAPDAGRPPSTARAASATSAAAPAEQRLYRRLRDPQEAARVWETSEQMVRTAAWHP